MSSSQPFRPGRPRAYVSAPGSPREGMDRARAWVAARAGALEWVSIGILLPDPAALNQSRYLRLARTRGATVGFTEDLGELCRWKGALIVDRPTLAGLVAAEASTAAAIVVVAQDHPVLQGWVDAFDPEHLGGPALAPAEVVLPVPGVRRAMVYFTHRLQSGACASPRMWQLLQHRLEHLHRHEGHFSVESLLALAWQLHWPPEATHKLHRWATDHLPPDSPTSW